MKSLLIIFSLTLLLFSCTENIATREQTDLYKRYQEIFKENDEHLLLITGKNDSTNRITQDLLNLTLDEFVIKHDIPKTEIDALLSNLKVSVLIIETAKNLHLNYQFIQKTNERIDNTKKELDSTNTNIRKIRTPNIDTTKVKIKIKTFGYDSTAK
jgi:hypothetical protein